MTVRHLLSHTSGYEDYAPQDYTIPAWTKPTSAERIVHEWATKPLDFEPGTQYQYSNTNFNILGLIVEKVSGEPFWTFLSRRVLTPLGMSHTIDLDTEPRPARADWLFSSTRSVHSGRRSWRRAAGTSPTARWRCRSATCSHGTSALMNQSLLEARVIRRDGNRAAARQTARLRATVSASVSRHVNGHRLVSHGGEVGGFVAQNMVFPDDKIAVAVLTNQEASSAAGAIGRRISDLMLPAADGTASASNDRARAETQAKQILVGLQQGKIDRALFTANCNFYFDQVALDDHASSLKPLGDVQTVTQAQQSLRGGMTFRSFTVGFANGTKLRLTSYTTSDGKLEQFLIGPIG